MTQDLDIVHLAVSRKGARILDHALEAFLDDYEDTDGFLESVRKEIKEQLPAKTKAKKKPRAK